jgi:probable addiction module antidote protein
MTLKTKPWDAADYLNTEEDIEAYLNAAFEDGDPALIRAALNDVARSKGLAEIARETGRRRTSLYRALSPEGNPEFATVVDVLKATGFMFSVKRSTTRRHYRTEGSQDRLPQTPGSPQRQARAPLSRPR